MTGLGLGTVEFLQAYVADPENGLQHKLHMIQGVNFATTEPVNSAMAASGAKPAKGEKVPTARVTEIMATALLGEFEGRSIEIPADAQQRDDLMKPEKLTSPGGNVSIAATRTESGHADHFWGYALAIRAILKIQAYASYTSSLC
jgi:phage FluMu gp28-like protein